MTVEEMKAVDIRTVSRDELVDIRDVVIDQGAPKEERIKSFLQQIRKNDMDTAKKILSIAENIRKNSEETAQNSFLSKCTSGQKAETGKEVFIRLIQKRGQEILIPFFP